MPVEKPFPLPVLVHPTRDAVSDDELRPAVRVGVFVEHALVHRRLGGRAKRIRRQIMRGLAGEEPPRGQRERQGEHDHPGGAPREQPVGVQREQRREHDDRERDEAA